jgi:hypothetical protein
MTLVDPVTREPLPAKAGERPRNEQNDHWRPGWRSGFEYESGVPARMWFAMCKDDCCAEYRASLEPLR